MILISRLVFSRLNYTRGRDNVKFGDALRPLSSDLLLRADPLRRQAEVLVAAIDDPHRFRNAREVSSYIGLVPKQYQSGQTDRHGRITKRGSRLLRTMLVECAWVALRYNAWAQVVYERIHGGQKTRRKKAGIALARKLAVVAWAMMRDETDWDIARQLPDCELEQGAIKVSQKPNLPAGPVHPLPKPLREPLAETPQNAASSEPPETRGTGPREGSPASQLKPQPPAEPAVASGPPSAKTTRPRNSGRVTEDARQPGEQHLDVTNGARGHHPTGARSPQPAARARQKNGFGNSARLPKGSPGPQAEPQPQADSTSTSRQSPARTTRPRNSGPRSEGTRRRGEQHLDVTNGARGHRIPRARAAKPAARARQKHGLENSGPLSKASPQRDTLT